MDPRIAEELANEGMSEGHKKLLEKCKSLVRMSRENMSEYYSVWDQFDNDYRGRGVEENKEEKYAQDKAAERGEPTKRKIPLAYAQIETFVAVGMSLLYQDDSLFPLEGVGPEDAESAKIAQALLDRDLDQANGSMVVEQLLKDIARFGIGILKTGWREETEEVEVRGKPEVVSLEVAGRETQMTQEQVLSESKVVDQGNTLVSVSPYRFFPDPRLPVVRFQEGEFVGSEEEHTRARLLRWEREGEISGIKHIKSMTWDEFETRGGQTRFSNSRLFTRDGVGKNDTLGVDLLTEIQIELIPSEFEFEGGPLGEEDYPVKYNIWIVNDHRIVKAEPLGYTHNKFTYSVGLYNPDQHHFTSEGLGEIVAHLQALHNWFINSHVTSVRKLIDNKLFVDPAVFEVTDLTERKPIIRMKPSAQGQDVKNSVFQLQLQDVTRTHVGDAVNLNNLMQEITGISATLLGQVAQGRRSATEMRNVSSAALSRVKKTVLGIYMFGLKPAANQMLDNWRSYITGEVPVRILGDNLDPVALENFHVATEENLGGRYDFKIFDPSTPQEKHLHANALQELLTWITATPVAASLPLDPGKIAIEILRLRGIKNLSRFIGPPPLLNPLINGQPGQTPGGGPQTSSGGLPGQQVLAMAPGGGSPAAANSGGAQSA